MNRLRVLLISHTYFPPDYRGKLRVLAAREDVEFRLVGIEWMRTSTGVMRYEPHEADSYPQYLLPCLMQSHNILRLYAWLPLVRLLREFRPEVVHIEVEPHALALTQIILLRALFHYRVLFFSWENILRSLPVALRAIERFNLSQADHGIAGSTEAAAILRQRGFHKSVSVVPQVGVDLQHHAQAVPDRKWQQLRATGPVIGYVGRLVEEKGGADLLNAFAQTNGAMAPHLLLVGGGASREELTTQAARLGVSERIHFVGNVAYRHVPTYLKCMDVMVLPSRTTAKWKEQFGHVLVEAMACGVPLIGSDSGAIPETIGDAGLVYPEGDVTALRACLLKVLQDRSLRCQLRERGLKRVSENYSDSVVAEKTYRVYRQLCP